MPAVIWKFEGKISCMTENANHKSKIALYLLKWSMLSTHFLFLRLFLIPVPWNKEPGRSIYHLNFQINSLLNCSEEPLICTSVMVAYCNWCKLVCSSAIEWFSCFFLPDELISMCKLLPANRLEFYQKLKNVCVSLRKVIYITCNSFQF